MVYELLEKAGMPKRILAAYRGFQEQLQAYNTVAGGIGEGYAKPTSIPQGDPLSMMIVALLLRAWIVEMKGECVRPRVLADDLQLIAVGGDHLGTFQKAFDKTHGRLEAMGAKLAPQKSVAFSTDGNSRNWLRQHKWRRVGRTINVLSNCRDLGAHINFAKRARLGTTLTARMRKATAYAKRVGRMKGE